MKTSAVTYKRKNINKNHEKVIDSLLEKGVNPVMAKLYALRGVENFADIDLVQKLEPFTNMLGAVEAAKILSTCILQKKKICVIADYDVDGATACAIAVRGIKMFGGNIDYVVPDRFIHGYGLTPSVVDEAWKKKNPDILITVDNGIASHEGIEYARKKGLDVLVTDHHLPATDKPLPNAICIVNPNQPGCNFKSKSIAGCGVMFYVLAALRKHMIDLGVYDEKNAPNVFSLLDLVAVGTIADVVKLDTNNRILVKIGLDLIRKGRTRAGIIALAEISKSQIEQLGTIDIGFRIGPRINAAGRLEDMTIGINCLLTDSLDVAKKAASELNSINLKRRSIETEMKDLALNIDDIQGESFSKVAFDKSFHEGVIGIVASRIKDLFYRPTIVFAPAHEEDLIKGSGRSIPEIHLRDAIDYVYKKAPGIIVKFGGHAAAAGLTIKKDKLEEFKTLFEESVKHFSGGVSFYSSKEIDMELESEHIDIRTAEMIKSAIWGQGFPQPLFSGKFNILDQRILNGGHLKLHLEKEGVEFQGIWFSRDQEIEDNEVEIVYSLGVNEFMNKKSVQIMIDNVIDLNNI